MVHIRWAVLLCLLTFAVYGNVIGGNFVWDDHLQVGRNSNIRSLAEIPRAFTSSLWSFMHAKGAGDDNRVFDAYYRPMQTVVYILGYRIGGLSPAVYHVINWSSPGTTK